MLKRRVGDVVKIKSCEWYNTNKNKYGSVEAGDEAFVEAMAEHCGKLATITSILENTYYSIDVDEESYSWTDEMFEDEFSNYNSVWGFGSLFIIVNERDKKVFPDFYTTKEEAEKKLWEITKKEIK